MSKSVAQTWELGVWRTIETYWWLANQCLSQESVGEDPRSPAPPGGLPELCTYLPSKCTVGLITVYETLPGRGKLLASNAVHSCPLHASSLLCAAVSCAAAPDHRLEIGCQQAAGTPLSSTSCSNMVRYPQSVTSPPPRIPALWVPCTQGWPHVFSTDLVGAPSCQSHCFVCRYLPKPAGRRRPGQHFTTVRVLSPCLQLWSTTITVSSASRSGLCQASGQPVFELCGNTAGDGARRPLALVRLSGRPGLTMSSFARRINTSAVLDVRLVIHGSRIVWTSFNCMPARRMRAHFSGSS